MEEKIHDGVAEAHLEIAEDFDNRFCKEKEPDKRKILRIVAAQNYFYSSINTIEAVFAKKLEQHSFNHENRYRKMFENRSLFTDEILDLFEDVDRNSRNKVAYKGENGKKYEDIKRLARLLNGLK